MISSNILQMTEENVLAECAYEGGHLVCLCMLCWSATKGNLSDCLGVWENIQCRQYLLWVIAFLD